MLFNSLDFAVFLPIVFALYWFVVNRSLKLQNGFIVAASYVFYGWWDWRFLGLILFSTIVDFTIGRYLHKAEKKKTRKQLLWISIIVNLGFLGFFKYYNFFLENFIEAFTFMGMKMEGRALSIILPVGISFYTFQTLSYTIDVYRKKIKPTKDFGAFAAFVSFFPQLVAGPIERATHLLPQFYAKREFDSRLATDGLRQILWGLFKKMVIADNCAQYANLMFENPGDYNGMSLALGAIFFAFQIYGDFSGYSDIAIGTSRLFGFDLRQNFAFPYFSRDIAEFWRRWHISLSTWFRDYVYIPLGGSRGKRLKQVRNVFIIFIVSGFWHGANWTYVVWGALNALFFLPMLLLGRNRRNLEVVAAHSKLPSLRDGIAILTTFSLTTLAWIFFRAESIPHALQYLGGILDPSFFAIPDFKGREGAFATLIFVVLLLLIEWLGRRNLHALENLLLGKKRYLRWFFYLVIVFIIIIFSETEESPFIYFQF